MSRASYEDRLEDIRRTEYGSRLETFTRHAGVLTGALVVWLAFDQPVAIAWGLLHSLLQIVFALVLTNRIPMPARERYRAAIALYTLTGLNYAAYPLHLLASAAPLPLMIAAGCGLFSQGMYILQRRQLEFGIVVIDVLQSTAVTVIFILVMLPQVSSLRDSFVVGAVPCVLLTYHLVALFSGLRQQQRLRETQARYAASQKARALNQFVGGVAHDFNNQLTAILGHLELHDVLDDPAERRDALDESRRAARRAALTVQQLLASSGRTRLNPRAVPLADVLANLKLVLGDLLGPGMRVTVVPPPDAATAWVDADMLETCLIQLCLNAQDATLGQGKIRLWVEVSDAVPSLDPAPDAKGPYATLMCEDNGPGVPKEALPLLAEPFYTTKNAHEGAGLGLSAVAGFARQSGGVLSITQAPLAGLRVALTLPVERPVAPPPRPKVTPAEGSSSPQPTRTSTSRRQASRRFSDQLSGS